MRYTALATGATLLTLAQMGSAAEGRFRAALLDTLVEGKYASDIAFRPDGSPAEAKERVTINGVPFLIARDKEGAWQSVDVAPSRWENRAGKHIWAEYRQPHFKAEDGDLVLHVPSGYYYRAHVLAVSDGREDKEPSLTLRSGYFQWFRLTDTTVDVPTIGADAPKDAAAAVAGTVVHKNGQSQQGRLFVIPIDIELGEVLPMVEWRNAQAAEAAARARTRAERQIKAAESRLAGATRRLQQGEDRRQKAKNEQAKAQAGKAIADAQKAIEKARQAATAGKEALAAADRDNVALFDALLMCRPHLYVGSPDPYLFLRLPTGQPSGVRVFAVTFEESPIRLSLDSQGTWNVFPDGQSPAFTIKLGNLSDTDRQVSVVARWYHEGERKERDREWKVALKAGETKELTHAPDWSRFGLHHYEVDVSGAVLGRLLTRPTTFAVLPKFEKAPLKPGLKSRFCTWWWNGVHMTPAKSSGRDLILGLGVGYVQLFHRPPNDAFWADLRSHGVNNYHESGKMVCHEWWVSVPHIKHYPRIFLDEPRYELSEEEEKKYTLHRDNALAACKKTRKERPEVEIILGNSGFNFVESLLHRKFPVELFDKIGHEVPCFMRLTERQPEHASFQTAWWYTQALKKHGYPQGVTAAAEWTCRSTNPGNLTQQLQANYYVRDMLHGLAYGYNRACPGSLEDVGTAYGTGNYGRVGLFARMPKPHPKLSYVAFAVLAHLLSDADFVRAVPVGSHSAYCLEFTRRRGDRVFACWTLRGRRPLTLGGQFGEAVRVTDQQGNATPLRVSDGRVTFEISGAPASIEGVLACKAADLGAPAYGNLPEVKQLHISSLDSLGERRVVAEPEELLDNGDYNTARQKGVYEVRAVDDPRKGQCLEFALKARGHRPPWIPSYQRIDLKKPVVLPGQPTAIALHVRGNSGWGRILLELRDAKGKRFVSIGAQDTWNGSDVEGLSYIIFDDWRWMRIPLPGSYPNGSHWPRMCNWWHEEQHNRPGAPPVAYPLTFTGLIVEQREQIVYVNEMVEASKQPIRLSRLTAVYGDPEETGDWAEQDLRRKGKN